MTPAESTLRLVEELPARLVESLIQQLRTGRDPSLPNPSYQARVEQFVRFASCRSELAPMLEVALAAKRLRQTSELVWTGPATSVVPVRRTEQVLSDLIDGAERKLTIMSFGIFQVPRWPHERRLRDAAGCAGLMHAKAAVADSRTAFLTSANLTEAALRT
jgi:phosphatidylserine/phosphatidylglycerophosphate/cardiolipin synthase-like enzyme